MTVALLGALSGCGSDDGDSEEPGGSNTGGSNTGGTNPSGATATGGSSNPTGGSGNDRPCGLQSCSPGQYCSNGICMNGCLTNGDCASGQSCADLDSDTKVGTCKSPDPKPPAKDCDTFCDKALACQDPLWVMCMQVCTGLSSECVACMNDSNCGAGCDAVCEL